MKIKGTAAALSGTTQFTSSTAVWVANTNATTHKTVTPALAQEILVGMKALNQLKNKGYEEKDKLLSTKYEDNLRCFMKKCNESKTLTDDDYTDMKEELNKEFGTLNGI